jgi:hypothetical protein
MRVLLDECVPRKLGRSLPGHECRTVPQEGFSGTKNGELLELAEKSGFQVFLTIDRGLEHQQKLQGRNITVILVRTKSGRLAELLPKAPEILKAISSARPGSLIKIG